MAVFISLNDDFNRTDSPLELSSEDWGAFDGIDGCTIVSEEVLTTAPTAGGHRRSYVKGSDKGRGQFCSVVLTAVPSAGNNISPNIHMSADGSRYELTLAYDGYGIWKQGLDGSQGWLLDKVPYAMAQGQVWGIGTQLSSEGDVVYITLDGGIIAGEADAELTGGFCGINQYAPSGGPGAIDDWESGYLRLGLSISNVNQNNVVVSKEAITIQGSALDLVDPNFVIIGDGNATNDAYLSVSSQTEDEIICLPVDIHSTKFSPETEDLVLYVHEAAGGDDQQASLPVTLDVESGHHYVVVGSVDSITPGLLNTTLIPALPGDIYEGPTTVDGQNVTLRADGPHANINPAPNDGSLAAAWFYSTPNMDWEEITETWNLSSGALAPTWNAIPNPTPCVVGVPYDYNIGALVSGQRPMTLTSVGDPLPAGLQLVSGAGEEQNERIEGTPTEAGEFTGIIVEADNGE